MTEEGRGVEVLDGAVSPTNTAATHLMDNKNYRVDYPSAREAQEGESVSNYSEGYGMDQQSSRRGDDDDENVSFQLGKLESGRGGGGAERMVETGSLPFDEDDLCSAVPIRHVTSDPMEEHGDDVSSLQHTNMEGKSAYARRERPEGAISEGDEADDDYYEYDEEYDAEHQRAIQRRNVLIVVMLVLFLGLVVAIATGVGMAVKENPDPDQGVKEDAPSAGTTTDDEFDGLGGGLDEDDQFATSVPSSFPSKEGPCIPMEVGIIFDEYSGETGWMLVKGEYDPEHPLENNIVWKSKYYKNSEYSKRADTFHKCFPQGEYTFVFTDKEGDGICCNHGQGSYVLSSEGKVITIGGEMTAEEEFMPFELPYVEPDPVDEDEDGRDDRLGWIMPYDSSNMTEGVDCENFRLVILTDEYGLETTWELFEGRDKSGVPIADGGPYGSEYNYVVDYCLASPREYSLYVYDWDRRGLCCESGEGMYRVTSGDIVIVASNGQFGEQNITRFALPADGSSVVTDEPASGSPTAPPASRGPTPTPKLWTTLVPGTKKTAYPTESPAAPSGSPTVPPVEPSASPTVGPTEAPSRARTSSPTRPDQLDAPVLDKEITPFPTGPGGDDQTVPGNQLDAETIDKVTAAMDAAEENKGNDKGGKDSDKNKDKEKEPAR